MPWRRFISIPGYFVMWLAWLAAAPVWLPATICIDLVRRSRGVALRSAGLVTVYLSCEVLGIVLSGGLWLWKVGLGVAPDRWVDVHFRLEEWWGTTLFRAVVWLFGLRIEIEDEADLGRGPYLLLLRHSSTADTLIASALVTRRHGVRLRYVLKREHLWDPCLDIVGHRVPNAFVDRFSTDQAREVARVQALARDLGPRDGVLIYPEGTRFSEEKRSRVLEKLREGADARMLDYASSLSHVLPPRPGGALGLLDVAPELDVVIGAHVGFEGTASLADIWRGGLVDQVVRIQFRRIARSAIPEEREKRVDWLLDEWQQVGAWVASHQRSDRSSDEPRGSSQS